MIRKNLDTRPWVMKIIDQIVSAQPGVIHIVNRALTHAKFYKYCYARLMRGTSAEETFQDKESHERMAATHGYKVCSYRVDNRISTDTLFKGVLQTCVQQISYC